MDNQLNLREGEGEIMVKIEELVAEFNTKLKEENTCDVARREEIIDAYLEGYAKLVFELGLIIGPEKAMAATESNEVFAIYIHPETYISKEISLKVNKISGFDAAILKAGIDAVSKLKKVSVLEPVRKRILTDAEIALLAEDCLDQIEEGNLTRKK